MPDIDDAQTASFERPAAPSPPPPGAPRLAIASASLSHPGKLRSRNEDHFLVARYSRSMELLATNLPAGAIPDRFDESGHIFIVADGLGGSAAGEVASRLAIETAIALALEKGKWALRIDDEEGQALLDRVSGFIREVDRAIGAKAGSDPALDGMGTTLTAAVAIGQDLFLFHVGDSRAYRIRAGRLTRLTRDQTVVQEMADSGLLTPEQASTHHLRHMLTQAVGRREGKVAVAADWVDLAAGDTLLLCTDGLTEHVDDAAIERVLGSAVSPDGACRSLVDLALAGGGHDNVTVVVAAVSAA